MEEEEEEGGGGGGGGGGGHIKTYKMVCTGCNKSPFYYLKAGKADTEANYFCSSRSSIMDKSPDTCLNIFPAHLHDFIMSRVPQAIKEYESRKSTPGKGANPFAALASR